MNLPISRRLKGIPLHLRPIALGTVALLAVSACGATASGGAGATAQAKTYSMTVLESTPGFFDLPIRVAAADYASKYHLKISFVYVTGGGALGTEFEGGTGTVALVATDTPLRLQQAGDVPGGVTILGTNMYHMLYALVSKAGSPYTSLESLKGQTLGDTGAGAASEVVLKWAIINKAHLPLSDFTITPVGSPPTILAAVESGHIAAGTVFSPALEEGLSSGQVQIAFDFRSYLYGQNVFMARTNEVKANPTEFGDFMDAYRAAVTKMYSNPAFALASAMKYWSQGTTESVVKTELKFYMNDEWKQTHYTEQLYGASKSVLQASGDFPAGNFPTYKAVTEYAPNV